MNRLQSNLEILKRLEEHVRRYPTIRLGQAMVNLGVVQMQSHGVVLCACDPFMEEPQDTLARMKLRDPIPA